LQVEAIPVKTPSPVVSDPAAAVLVVGTMFGNHPGQPMAVGEELAARLAAAGYDVEMTSRHRPRLRRLLDVMMTIVAHGHRCEVQILQVYSGASFILEDIASWLGRRMGQRIIMHIHGGSLPEFMERYPRWTGRVLGRAAALVAPSPFLQRALTKHDFAAEVIPNAVDVGGYPYRHRQRLSPRLLWMRSFHQIYNPQMAVRVLAKLRQRHPSASLVIAGQDKGLEPFVRRLAQELHVADAVRFAGFLDHQGKMREGSAADIFLNTNRVDNTPVSIIEACAMGLPVVATNVGGIADLVEEGRTALLVPDDDDQAMVAAIERLLAEPELAGALSAAGRRLAEQLSWEYTQPRWNSLIRHVSQCGSSPSPPANRSGRFQ
jgi:glycosyltransferase involved in cell wall biosynthesis